MKISKTLALLMAFATGFSGSQVAFAQEMPNSDESGYLEYHYQVNFDDLDVFVVNGTTLDIVDNSQGINVRTANAVDALTASFAENSDAKNKFIDMLNENKQLAAISFTEAPLLFKEDHYERVTATDDATHKTSKPNENGKFTLYTYVSRDSFKGNGVYSYTSTTFGSWSENSAKGGRDYPDSGTDYVLQTVPTTWTIQDEKMIAIYDNDPYIGKEGQEFWSMDGGENYLQYAIEDDPYDFAKARQNKNFSLECTWDGDATTSSRIIRSYYVHTWTQLSISVSATIKMDKTVELSITPSIEEKNWPLYNKVTFNF